MFDRLDRLQPGIERNAQGQLIRPDLGAGHDPFAGLERVGEDEVLGGAF